MLCAGAVSESLAGAYDELTETIPHQPQPGSDETSIKNVTVHVQVCNTDFRRKMGALHAKSEVCANRNRLCFPSIIPPEGGTTNGSHCERLLKNIGKRHWIWCITAAPLSVFHVARARFRGVLERLVGTLSIRERLRRSLIAMPSALPSSEFSVENRKPDRLPAKPFQSPWRQQVCLRDIRHDHVLITDNDVNGIVDYDGMRVELPVGNVTRLLGSQVGNNQSRCDIGVAGYESVRPLSPEDRDLP